MFQPIVLSTVKNFHAYFDTVNDRDYSSPDIGSNIIEFCLKKQREREREGIIGNRIPRFYPMHVLFHGYLDTIRIPFFQL